MISTRRTQRWPRWPPRASGRLRHSRRRSSRVWLRSHARRDDVVVLRLARIGQRGGEELVARRVPCIAVERNEDVPGVHAARRLRVPVLLADISAPGVLDGLYLAAARCLMVLTDDD